MIKLHEIQQALEALGIYEEIYKASQRGGGNSTVITGGGTWGGIQGVLANQLDLQAALDLKSDVGHIHDDRYYTEGEVDTLLTGYSLTTHNHDGVYLKISENLADLNNVATARTNLGLGTMALETASNYYTSAQVDTLLNGKEDVVAAGTTAQYYRGDKTWATLNTSVVPESGNLYYTDARVQTFGDARYSQLGHIHDDRYYTESEIDTLLTGYSEVGHIHDDRYYTEDEVDTLLDAKVDANAPITGSTKTKITYDAKGLVTAGADATTADINDSLNRRYVTDAQLVVIGNTSGTNTGDQTSIVGITGTKAQFDTALTDGNFLYVDDITQYTDELAQDAVAAMLTEGAGIDLTYDDVANTLTIANTGVLSITGTANQVIASGSTGAITLSLPQNIHTGATPTFADLVLSSFTEGSVLFAGASGAISHNSNAFYWNNSTSHLQISGVSPGGITLYDESEDINLNMINSGAIAGFTCDNGGQLIFDGPSTGIVASSTVYLYINGSQKVTVDSNGDVGIGNTDPQNRLHIETGSGVSAVRIGSATANADRGMFLTTVGDNAIMSNRAEYILASGGWIARDTTSSQIQLSAGIIYFLTNSGLTDNASFSPTERMRISTTGDVGIGITPSYKLDVNGTFRASGNVFLSGASAQIDGYALLGNDLEVTGNSIFQSNIAVKADLNVLYSAIISSASTTNLTAALAATHTGAITGTGYAGQFVKTGASTTNVGLYASATGATNNYGLIVDAGWVGINTATPGWQFDLVKADAGGLVNRTYNTAAGTGNYAQVRAQSNDTITVLNALSSTWSTSGINLPSSSTLEGTGTNGLSIGATNATGTIRFYTGGSTERARFSNTGMFGLGVTSVATRLHIGGVGSGLAAITMAEETATPANPSSGAEFRVYMKADKIVLQYNDAGTVRYKYLDLTGTGVTWVHTTSAP